jgi:protein-S-isoprenylcysteine O-methyltransferase Ste14
MSRQAVGALFAVFTAGTVMQLVPHIGDAVSDPAPRTWLVAIFWLLKSAIVLAFAYFVVVRPPALRRARDPIAFVACAAAILGALALRPPEASGSTALLLAGDAIAALSAGWVLTSVLALGRCFGFLPEARGLVTRGPYRLVRHPVYLGELGMAGGLLMASPSAWNAVAVAVLAAGQAMRMRLEEQALVREFPEYASYASRTPRLLPAIAIEPRTLLFGAVALTVVAFAGSHAAFAAKPKAKAKPAPRLTAPRQLTPAASARLAAVPSFSWAPVAGAAKYDFQLAVDPAFESIVDGQGHGAFRTANTFGSVDKTLADGTYYWRVRAIGKNDRAGRWSAVRSFVKRWDDAPALRGPANGATVRYPGEPLVLSWSPVPFAYKYLVTIATDPSLAHSALGDRLQSAETSGTDLALPTALARGTYYWAVTPLDAGRHPGTRSAVGSFTWDWPTTTATRVTDLRDDPRLPNGTTPRLYDPQFAWDSVPGAAQYQVEVNPTSDFVPGSRVCCDDVVLGTSLSPRKLLGNNTYHWRVRAIDLDGNAGDWNVGPTFRKDFDAINPSIPNLHVRDNQQDAEPARGGLVDAPVTDSPVIAWDPVPGASSYEVNVVPWEDGIGACDWGTSDSTQHWTTTTATTAWTPLSGAWNLVNPAGKNAPILAFDGGNKFLRDGSTYCAQIRARSDRDAANRDVRGDWTQVGGPGEPAFTYQKSPLAACDAAPAMQPEDYHAPTDGRRAQNGTANRRTPLFTWEPVPGACSYYVVVARDRELTNVVDVALTNEPAYAPRGLLGPTNYTDETTTYYWSVVPAMGRNGSTWTALPTENSPQEFEKLSRPPGLLGPADGADVYSQPTFHWSPPTDEEGRPLGVRNYHLQVDDDPTFGSPIDDVVTDSTGYTSTSTYPADTTLYWRVRADVEAANDPRGYVGLTWSAVGKFQRRLPAPSLSPTNPVEGQGIPLFTWSPVDGAVSYDMHIEQANGTKLDFTFRATAFTPIAFYGVGIWHWQVRANFKGAVRTVSSGYTPLAAFARHIDTPAGIRTTKTRNGSLLSWNPSGMARKYRIQIATSDSFTNVIEDAITENTNYAPRMLHPAYQTGAPLYWRVAAMDEGFNLGAWASSQLRQDAPLRVSVRGRVRVGHTSRVRVRVTDARRRPLKGVHIRVGGSGMAKARNTSRRGTVVLRVRGVSKGKVTLLAEKRGYLPRSATLRVR